MRVKLLASFCGATNYQRGDEAEFADDEAVRLISAGFAVPAYQVRIETAVKAPAREKRKK